jgi:SAM-dependent methyltransferase
MANSKQSSRLFGWIKYLHGPFVLQRRVQVLAKMLASQIPQNASVLDVGCGDGTVASLITKIRPDISIQGVEVLARPECKIACSLFDGITLPFPDCSFDVCVFVDVLHHSQDIRALLQEAVRVSRAFVLLKDHLSENFLDNLILGVMDWVGNRPYGVHIPYNFQSRKQWADQFEGCGLTETTWTSRVPLYPPPFNYLFGRELHFVCMLRKDSQLRREVFELAGNRTARGG